VRDPDFESGILANNRTASTASNGGGSINVIFMGTPEFAVSALRALVSVRQSGSHQILAVYTRSDSVSGRGGTRRPSPVALLASELGIELHKPQTLRDSAVIEGIAELAPDIIVVAAYGLILPPEVLAIPRFGCVNIHASLLPRWRGAAPVERAILAGDAETGVSIMQMEAGLDTGPYCAQATVSVDDRSRADLLGSLAELGAHMLVDALDAIGQGTAAWVVQDETLATYAEKITKAEVTLFPELTLEDGLRRVRASSPQAPSRLQLAGRLAAVTEMRRLASQPSAHDASSGCTQLTYNISPKYTPQTHNVVPTHTSSAHDASPESTPPRPGAVLCSKRELIIGLSDGYAVLERVRPDGKGEMAGADWARGARFDDAVTWGGP